MPIVLGIDASLTSTGICKVNTEVPIGLLFSTGTIKTKPVPGDTSFAGKSNRIAQIINQIDSLLRPAGSVDLVVLEGPSYASSGTAVYTLGWLWGAVFDFCSDMHGIETLVVAPSLRAKYATGKGNAAKDAVLTSVIRRWPDVPVDGNDQADALILAAIGCRYLGHPIDEMPKDHWQPVMAKLA